MGRAGRIKREQVNEQVIESIGQGSDRAFSVVRMDCYHGTRGCTCEPEQGVKNVIDGIRESTRRRATVVTYEPTDLVYEFGPYDGSRTVRLPRGRPQGHSADSAP